MEKLDEEANGILQPTGVDSLVLYKSGGFSNNYVVIRCLALM
jgi:hypothetical protein